MATRLFANGAVFGRTWAIGPVAAACLGFLAVPGCWRGASVPVDDPSRLTITLRSPAFSDGGMIPKEYTCDGSDRSPPLEWTGVPQSARELALICDDPDAPMGTWSHWVIISLPAAAKGLKEGVPPEMQPVQSQVEMAGDASLKSMVAQGKNDFGKFGYGGPCPPSGTHRYSFRLYALDSPVSWSNSPPNRAELLKAIQGHILAEGRLVGKFAR
jgi:Raf kinase inhibitor-like YbhB/YbcL family protein